MATAAPDDGLRSTPQQLQQQVEELKREAQVRRVRFVRRRERGGACPCGHAQCRPCATQSRESSNCSWPARAQSMQPLLDELYPELFPPSYVSEELTTAGGVAAGM